MVNVGWLGRDQPFSTGDVPEDLRTALLELARDPKNIMRGLHDCELCGEESPIMVPFPRARRGRVALGTGEIHVEQDGTIYSAPTLIIHYVDKHHYRPPEDFLQAVASAASSDDDRQGDE